jgi:hypothetical protein
MPSAQNTLRQVRILHAVFIATWFLFFVQLRFINPPEHALDPIIVYAISVACVADIGIALSFRARMISPALETLRTRPDDSAALGSWRVGNILSFTFAETVILFGFVLKILGARWNVAGIFFAASLFLFGLWTPRLDLPVE